MRTVWTAAVLLVVCACAGPQRSSRAGAAEAARSQDAAARDAAARTIAEAASRYRLSTDDLIAVSVYQDHELNARTRVDAEGNISMPLVGTVKVGGATIAEAQKRIEDRLSEYLVRPQASLVVEAYANKVLFVLGEVQKPGSYSLPIDARLTALQAISDAGGFTRIAAPGRTHVFRNVDGKLRDYTIDLKGLIRHRRGADMALEPNDVIYVPQSMF